MSLKIVVRFLQYLSILLVLRLHTHFSANRLENDGSFIVQRSYNDGSNTLHMEDESGGGG